MDFEDVRGYAPGDDVRHIDWNVTARMNETYVKEFKEERELSVILAIDVSASGEWSSALRTRRELAAEVAACLAFSAIGNGDKVGLVLFSDRIERYLPPMKGRIQGLRVIRDALGFRPKSRGTSLKQTLNLLTQIHRRPAIVFLLSDFLDDGYDRSLKAACRKHDLIPILIADGRERNLPDAGIITLGDSETGGVVELDTSDPDVRAAFARLSQARIDDLRHRFRQAGTELIELTTGEPFIGALQQYMERRMTRRAG
jgi:uncharacterized protein (DUF58 family)